MVQTISAVGPSLDAVTAQRFAESARCASGAWLTGADFDAWFADRGQAHSFNVTRIPFAAMEGWHFDPDSGNLGHRSGKFFTVEGLEVTTDYGAVRRWSQPIIHQPEIGVLGILVKEFDGVLHFLMQAKMEPGNVNVLQLSPTVQATRSNYMRVHAGSGTRYLEHFARPRGGRVLVDVLQSEQGAWFFHKRNRNMIIEVTEDIPVHEDFCWLTLGQLHALLRQDNVVNMDARTVLSCLPLPAGPQDTEDTEDPEGTEDTEDTDLLSWFTEAKCRYELRSRRITLNQVGNWSRDQREIAHADHKYFDVIAVAVQAGSREVGHWTQPLVAPRGMGIVAALVKRVGGVPHLLMHARVEAGYHDMVELAPTVQCTVENYRDVPIDHRPAYLDYVLAAHRGQLRYDVVLSEEGGRFYHACNRYLVIEVDEDFPDTVDQDYRWVSVDDLGVLLRHSYYLNVEARSLLACFRSLS